VARILFLAYHFPPVGGGGVQRNVKFARYLDELGHELVVVTGSGSVHDYWTPRDDTLAAEIPPTVKVLRVVGEDPVTEESWRRRASRWAGGLDPFDRWWIEASTSVALQADARPDVIYASLAPFTTGIGAARLAARMKQPWIADLQDPWAVDEIRVYASALHRWLDRRRMTATLRTASVIVMNTEEAAARLARELPELGASAVVIPNGYDASDFAADEVGEGHRFRIVHTGYLYTAIGLRRRRLHALRRLAGGEVGRVDLTTRSHLRLMQALRRLLDAGAIPPDNVELHLAGVMSETDRMTAAAPFVRVHGYVHHARAVALMRAADLLFLPLHEISDGRRSTIVPGKTYEYLASGRPILAAVPEGDARDLLARAAQARVCAPGDVDAIAEAINNEFQRWVRHGRHPSEPIPPWLEPYERRELTRRLAALVEDVSRHGRPRQASARPA
jgi:glycosyltransferase involved in cell wall biosynthesis